MTRVVQIAAGEEHTILLGKSKRVYACGNNDRGQLGLSGIQFETPEKAKETPKDNLRVIGPLQSIGEVSMDNSVLMRRTDDLGSLKAYVGELEDRLRESEAAKDFMMSETLKFINSLEKFSAEQQRQSTGGLSRQFLVAHFDQVLSVAHPGAQSFRGACE